MERNQDPSEGSSSEYGEPNCKKMKLDDSVPKQVDVPTEEKSEEEYSVKDKSFDTSDEEDSSSSTDDESSSPRDMSNMPKEFVNNTQKINHMIRSQLIKEIQQFGRIHDRIFYLLEDVRGPLSAKKSFVQFAIQEARKYKGSFLIEQLKAYLESMCTYHQEK